MNIERLWFKFVFWLVVLITCLSVFALAALGLISPWGLAGAVGAPVFALLAGSAWGEIDYIHYMRARFPLSLGRRDPWSSGLLLLFVLPF